MEIGDAACATSDFEALHLSNQLGRLANYDPTPLQRGPMFWAYSDLRDRARKIRRTKRSKSTTLGLRSPPAAQPPTMKSALPSPALAQKVKTAYLPPTSLASYAVIPRPTSTPRPADLPKSRSSSSSTTTTTANGTTRRSGDYKVGRRKTAAHHVLKKSLSCAKWESESTAVLPALKVVKEETGGGTVGKPAMKRMITSVSRSSRTTWTTITS